MAAEKVTTEAINFMARFGRGLICLTLTPEQIEKLNLSAFIKSSFDIVKFVDYGNKLTLPVDIEAVFS